MDVLESDVARQLGHVPLTGPFELSVSVVCGGHLVFDGTSRPRSPQRGALTS